MYELFSNPALSYHTGLGVLSGYVHQDFGGGSRGNDRSSAQVWKARRKEGCPTDDARRTCGACQESCEGGGEETNGETSRSRPQQTRKEGTQSQMIGPADTPIYPFSKWVPSLGL